MKTWQEHVEAAEEALSMSRKGMAIRSECAALSQLAHEELEVAVHLRPTPVRAMRAYTAGW